jgi:hypothetical protein
VLCPLRRLSLLLIVSVAVRCLAYLQHTHRAACALANMEVKLY